MEWAGPAVCTLVWLAQRGSSTRETKRCFRCGAGLAVSLLYFHWSNSYFAFAQLLSMLLVTFLSLLEAQRSAVHAAEDAAFSVAFLACVGTTCLLQVGLLYCYVRVLAGCKGLGVLGAGLSIAGAGTLAAGQIYVGEVLGALSLLCCALSLQRAEPKSHSS